MRGRRLRFRSKLCRPAGSITVTPPYSTRNNPAVSSTCSAWFMRCLETPARKPISSCEICICRPNESIDDANPVANHFSLVTDVSAGRHLLFNNFARNLSHFFGRQQLRPAICRQKLRDELLDRVLDHGALQYEKCRCGDNYTRRYCIHCLSNHV